MFHPLWPRQSDFQRDASFVNDLTFAKLAGIKLSTSKHAAEFSWIVFFSSSTTTRAKGLKRLSIDTLISHGMKRETNDEGKPELVMTNTEIETLFEVLACRRVKNEQQVKLNSTKRKNEAKQRQTLKRQQPNNPSTSSTGVVGGNSSSVKHEREILQDRESENNEKLQEAEIEGDDDSVVLDFPTSNDDDDDGDGEVDLCDDGRGLW